MSTTVRESMTANPRSIAGDATVVEAAKLMASENVGSLPVVEGGKLVGIVTDRDLVMKVVARGLDAGTVPVSDVYSERPVVATPDEPLDQALHRMAQEQVRRLPVVDEGKLVGILAQADVARTAEPESTGHMVEEISQEEGQR
ncbi:MAG TPA: CBS domain-containing protein [Gaiellaceae bacterium]|nr:CBS domain-containing protein [Gaiellaceae bacterium]